MTAFREEVPGYDAASASPAAQPNLVNSQRVAYKATYAPALVEGTAPPAGRVLEKAGFIRRLGLTSQEAITLRGGSPAAGPREAALSQRALDLVVRVTAARWPDALRLYGGELASTAHQDLAAIGHAVAALREAAARAAVATPAQPGSPAGLAGQTRRLATVFALSTVQLPVGALHLERMEMTPVGVERGELVHSVPMTPGETVNISHKEWTVTTETFESIVTDSFEGFSETGVTDKTDLTQATESETKHSSSLDISGSVTASYNGGAYSVTAAAATNYSDKNDVHNTVKQSIAHSQAVTRHASARTRKEHKTSFKVSSVAGAEDLAVRTLHNAAGHPVRVDYFQLIRKWKVDLIRYGLRLTYDLVIPNPGLDMIGFVKELQELEEWMSAATFAFDQPIEEITPDQAAWLKLETKYGIALDPPPSATQVVDVGQQVGKHDGNVFDFLALDVPENYALTSGWLQLTAHGGDNLWAWLDGRPAAPPPGGTPHNITMIPPMDLGARFPGQRGHFTIPWSGGNFDAVQFTGQVTGTVLPEIQDAWRSKTWLALHDYALERFNGSLERAKDRKAYLEAQIAQFDALTLRKMEHEEVMKWVLEWLLPSNPLTSNPIHDLATDWPPAQAAERPPSATALFRLVRSTSSGRDHFYTFSAAERDSAITADDYHDEGVAGFVYTSDAQAPDGTVPLYRFRDVTYETPTSPKGPRYYTISSSEYNDLLNDPHFAYECVACYVYPAAAEGTVPLHRLLNTDAGDRLYTTSDQERLACLANGYRDEGDACFIYPPDPPGTGQDVESVEGADPGAMTRDEIGQVLAYGELIKFLHNAVEWENMLFFVYPYFWDDAENWPFKRFLMHPDPVHREFLRGGAARVVLTVRPGYEDAFVRLIVEGNSDTGDPGVLNAIIAAGKYPYVTLGQEIRNQSLANYENIPPANPDPQARPLIYPIQRAAWNEMQSIIAVLEAYNLSPGSTEEPRGYPPGPEAGLPGRLKQFLKAQTQTITVPAPGGTTTTVDTWAARLWKSLQAVRVLPAGNFDDPAAKFTDPWGNPYHYAVSSAVTPLLHGDYELVCYGSDNPPGSNPGDPLAEHITSWADGLLVATWFEYTPTSALDVNVSTPLPAGGPLNG